MKRLILSLPVHPIEEDAVVETEPETEQLFDQEITAALESSGTLALRMPGSHECNGRYVLDVLTPDDDLSPSLFGDDVRILYDGEGAVDTEILNCIVGTVLPHSWAGTANPFIATNPYSH